MAHLHAAETALFAGLDRVLFVPAGDPWQKTDREVTAVEHRVAMTRISIEGIDGFEIDLQETERQGPSYTIDTLESFPDDDELFLILGADAAAGIHSWHRAEDVLDRARMIVVPRPGTPPSAVTEALPGALRLEMAALDLSSTMIRAMAAEGRPYRFLVPEGVYGYILAENLYAKPETGDRVDQIIREE
ncbi:MAG: nicotinate (nicotinamide) nucleotide adenylyltransferase [Actinobacteria bacterium]|nr:MAG: nicotinate (nicotinamide) nucleotide adenylyltransferase [Actinomycetota bacterium]